jgi:acetyltransferase-like isoleucine patch superfamily enzyme
MDQQNHMTLKTSTTNNTLPINTPVTITPGKLFHSNQSYNTMSLSPQAKHPSMILGTDVFIFENAFFGRPDGVEIGDHSAIDYGFYCTVGEFRLRRYVHIASHVSVIGGKDASLTMEDFSFIASGSRIVCGSESYLGEGLVGPRIPDQYKDVTIIEPIVFKKFSGVGSNCIVMPGVTLAEGSIVGGNSYIAHDTEPWTIYVGNPAKPVKKRRSDRILEYAQRIYDEASD